MAGKLVTLKQVETRVEAQVIVTMLAAYGIYAISPEVKQRNDL